MSLQQPPLLLLLTKNLDFDSRLCMSQKNAHTQDDDEKLFSANFSTSKNAPISLQKPLGTKHIWIAHFARGGRN